MNSRADAKGQSEIVVKKNRQVESRIQETGYPENPEKQDRKSQESELQHHEELAHDGNPGSVRKFLGFHLLASKTVLICQLNQDAGIPGLVEKYTNEIKWIKNSHNKSNNPFIHYLPIVW